MRTAALGTIFLCILAAGCTTREQAPKGWLVVALESAPRTLDPRLATDAASAKLGDLLYNGLVRREDDFSIVPDLAEKWDAPDATTWRFTLRDGAAFHDGRPVTAADVAATYRWILDPANASPHRGLFAMVASIDTPGDRTVVFHLAKPSAPFLGQLTLGIVPAGSDERFADHPVGTGPFRFVENRRDERLDLASFPGCFDGAPKLPGVRFRIIPDETVRSLELESGGVHLIMNPLTPDLLPRFRANPRLRVIDRPGTNYSYLGFNLDDRYAGDRAVREAVALGIDRKAIITHLLKGLAAPATGMLAPANRFAAANLPVYDYDPARAREILDEAGYPDPDGDGPAVRFTLEYSTSQNELRKRIAEVIQWQLSQIGVGIDIKSYEWGTFYGNIKAGRFQLFSLTWVGIADPDILHYVFHSSSIPPAGANRGRYRNERVDALLDEGRTAPDGDRKAIYDQVQRIIAADLPYVPLWYPVNVAVTDARVEGFAPGPDENLRSLATTRLAN